MGALRVCNPFPRLLPPHSAMPSPQDAQERRSSKQLVHPQACKCLCPSRHLAQRFLWRWARPALGLGCRSSRGPLGLARGFYHARVRRLDVARFNSKHQHIRVASGVQDATRHNITRPLLIWASKSHSGMSGSGNTGDQEEVENEKILELDSLLSVYNQ